MIYKTGIVLSVRPRIPGGGKDSYWVTVVRCEGVEYELRYNDALHPDGKIHLSGAKHPRTLNLGEFIYFLPSTKRAVSGILLAQIWTPMQW